MYVCIYAYNMCIFIYIYNGLCNNGFFSREKLSDLLQPGPFLVSQPLQGPPAVAPSPPVWVLCAAALGAAAGSRGLPALPKLTLCPSSHLAASRLGEHGSPHLPLPPVCHHGRAAELLPPALQHILTHKELRCCCQRSAALRARAREGASERSARGKRAILAPSVRGRILASQRSHVPRAELCPQGACPTLWGFPGWFSTVCRSKELPLPVPCLVKSPLIMKIEFLGGL